MNKQLVAVVLTALTLVGTTGASSQNENVYSKKQKAAFIGALVVATAATTYYFHDQIKETGNLLKEEGKDLWATTKSSFNRNVIEPVKKIDVQTSLSQARSNVSDYLCQLSAKIKAIFNK